MTAEPGDFLQASTPTLIVVGDTSSARARGAAAAAAAAFPVVASLDLDAALARLAGGSLPDCVIVEIEADQLLDADAAAFEALLAQLHTNAGAGKHGSVVATPIGLIDLVAARAAHPRIEQLAAASPIDCALALGIVARMKSGRVRETPGTALGAAELRALAEEVSRMSGRLARLLPPQGPLPDPAPATAPRDETPAHAGLIRDILRRRRLRGRFFDPELFADPAWDMLLDLMGAHLDARPVAVSSLCIAAAVPATTALRWIRLLTEAGMFVRRADPNDGRRVFIELSERAAEGMREYLEAVR